ncbi:MAG: hypothetical protein IMF06_04595 [Proteobacteria bacterium]|nr:hypothetical protein [Pseudomonadota bacterium]
MLNRYSSSPSRSLRVKPSRRRIYFIIVLGAALALANYLLYVQGYPLLSAQLTLVSIVLLWWATADPMAGSTLKWEGGEWYIRHRGRQTSVVLLPGAVRLPWLVYAAFRETHAKQRWAFLLFSDSATVEQMRRLRCRLILEQG